MGDVLVELQKVTKHYPRRGIAFRNTEASKGFTAVRDVTLAIPRGSIFGLVGESGCGKTTLARSLLYLDPPTSGRVLFDGVDLSALSSRDLRAARQHMQIVFQDPNAAMNPKLSVRTSLAEGVRNLGLDRSEIEKRIVDAVTSVGIPSTHIDRKPNEFSGGQKQRLVLARALTMNPTFLVLDEPVSNLDVSIQAQIVNLLVDLKNSRSLTYLFISHDLNLVGYVSDYMAVMFGGRIVEVGPTEDVLAKPLHIYTRTLFGSSARVVDHASRSLMHGLHRDDKIGAKSDEAGCPFRPACSMSTTRCLSVNPRLRWVGSYRGIACHAVSGKKAR